MFENKFKQDTSLLEQELNYANVNQLDLMIIKFLLSTVVKMTDTETNMNPQKKKINLVNFHLGPVVRRPITR